MTRQGAVVTLVLSATLAVLLVIVALRTRSAYFGAREARTNFARCQQLTVSIRTLRQAPTQATLAVTPAGEITRRLELAARRVEISASQLVRIDPRPVRRMGDSPYLAQETNVELRQTTLSQLVQWLREVASNAEDLTATGLRLTAPRSIRPGESEPVEHWSAEVTLTHLVFSPQSRQSPN